MIRRDVIIASLATFCLTAMLFMIVPTQSMEPYDPWSDIDDNGFIDVKDILDVALRYGTLGDPTKQVIVTNWPTSTDISVWWRKDVHLNSTVLSPVYNATGFGHLHVLGYATNLRPGGGPGDPENMTVMIQANLYDSTHTGNYSLTVYSIVLTASSNQIDITIDVPSETFYFRATTDPFSDGSIFLSFYLTWA